MKTLADNVSERSVDNERSDAATRADQEPVDAIYFDRDADALRTADLVALRELLPQLRHRRVIVTGYTDSTGAREHNGALARRRARAVERQLVSLGIPANAIRVQGQGGCCYRASNDTAAGRAENRRVEIVTSATTPAATAAPTSD